MAKQGMWIEFSFDAGGPIMLFDDIIPRQLPQWIKKGAGAGAIRVQDIMRAELDRLIYSTPESPNYKRTHTLMRATYAARPGANHSGDHAAAKAGQDLRVSAPAAGGVVKLVGYVAQIDVGSWADWAWHVHEGHGNGSRIPKPFTVRPLNEAQGILREEIGQALNLGLASILR